MPDREQMRAECARLDKLCGVDSSGIELVISRRMTQQLGSFRYPVAGGGKAPRIAVSALLLPEEEVFWDTFRHEYAHAVVWLRHGAEPHGHDEVWKAVCRQIGCRDKATAVATEAQIKAREARARYRVRCGGCGRESLYLRAGKAVKLLKAGRAGVLRCTLCGSRDLKLYEK